MQKPLLLVHERDEGHGGAPLARFRDEAPDELRHALFHRRDVVPWSRKPDFQLTSMVMITEAILHASPKYHKGDFPWCYVPFAITTVRAAK
eukprot:5545458-Pleurochrysis_carterae.AAC.1